MTTPPATPTPDTLVLIDGHALAFRSLFALRRGEPTIPKLTNSKGEATDAIVGFMRLVLRLAKQKSNQVIVVFDPPVKTFRHEEYEAYKSGRSETPEDLPGQVDRMRELVDACGFPRLEEPGYEADDVIASLTRKAEGNGMQVRIVTSDRDTYQLLDDHVRVIANDFTLIGPDEVVEKYGVTVQQWVDFRAMTGDPSDNIPGAKGIGPKTASKWLQQYETLEKIWEAAKNDTLKPDGARKKMLAAEEEVALSHRLSRMVTDLPLEVEFGVPRGAGDPEKLQALIEELELKSLKNAFAGLNNGSDEESGPPDAVLDAEAAQQEPEIPALPKYQKADWSTPSKGVIWGYTLSKEADLTAELVGAAVMEGQNVKTAPIHEPEEWKQAQPAVQESLFPDQEPTDKPLTKTQQKAAERAKKAAEKKLAKLREQYPPKVSEAEFVGQREVHTAEAKALAGWLSVRGTQIEPGEDPMLHAYLLDPSNINMKIVCERYLQQEWPSDPAQRAAISAHLLNELPRLLDEKRLALYSDMEKPLSRVLKNMEVRGIKLDIDYLQTLSIQIGVQLDSLEKQIHDHAGEEFQIRSPKQLAGILYDKLGLASSKKTKLTGKRSTAVSALEPLREEHPIIPLVLEYRELDKLRGTYLDPLPSLVNPTTGRLHTTFNQTNVATGRLSSLNPNLQNIPIRSEQGRQIRKGFIADQGCVLVCADYSQIELRLLAHISGDKLMQQAFAEGADIHRRTAAQVLNVPEDQIDDNQRRAAKTVNFGVLYGMSAHRLSGDLGISYEDASGFIETYFNTYPNIRTYINDTLEHGRSKGFVETLYGRRRYVPELHASNRNVREAGERLAYNMPIQGTAADIMKIAMIKLEEPLKELEAHLLLQVHDELVIEAPEAKAEEVAKVTEEVMRGAVELTVPLDVEAGIGPNWFDAK